MAAIGVVIGTVLLLVVARLADVQVISAGKYARLGSSQLLHTVVLTPRRGAILDSAGDVLAMSIPQTTIVADPYQVSDPYRESEALAPVLGIDQSVLQRELSENAGFVYLARQVPDAVAARARALHLAGISFQQEPKRFDPAGQLAQPLLGRVGIDGNGLSGLEYEYNSLLSGRPGREVLERDPEGGDIPGGVRSYQRPVAGQGLVLSLDQPLQYEAETALSQQIVRTRALGGVAIVMDTRTGDILAMANMQAGTNGAPPVQSASDLAVSDVYEPGSVMKGPILSGALESHLVSPMTRFSVPDQMTIGGADFHDADSHPTEPLSVSDIIAQSSNIGAYEVASLMGKSGVYDSLRAFGFGQPSGVGLPGESAGILLPPDRWSATSLPDEAIGQEEAVTPLQVLDAYNAIANGGEMVQPRVVEATVGSGGTRYPLPLRPGRRVVSVATAQEMTSMLEQVVQDPQGTGNAAAISGYAVAGKTGTAQKPIPNGDGYEPNAYMASFVGFAPAQHPALSAIVVLDQPDSIYGGAAAAPVFAQIAQYGLRQLEVPPAAGAVGQGPLPQSAAPAGSAVPPVDASKIHTSD
jgi:cell division protein FtsI (penicillin-binding protein 3)